jgi:plasmid stability protein
VANLTVSIDDRLLKRARVRALEEDTSVNALVREYLESFATGSSRSSGMEDFLAWAQSVHASSGSSGRTWTRDELHER